MNINSQSSNASSSVVRNSLNVSQAVKNKIQKYKPGRVFAADQMRVQGNHETVLRTLSRMVREGEIQRIQNGIYYKPEYSKVLKGKSLPPNVNEVIKVISKKNKEVLQVHGATAANWLGLSTQIPMKKIYYTTGITRELEIAGAKVKLVHSSNKKLFQAHGTEVGLAIAAMHYLGKELVNEQVIQKIKSRLNEQQFEQLKNSPLPSWMKRAVISENNYA